MPPSISPTIMHHLGERGGYPGFEQQVSPNLELASYLALIIVPGPLEINIIGLNAIATPW